MKSVVNFLILLCCVQVNAQKAGLSFRTSVHAGLLEGERGSAFQLQAVHGVQYKTWSAGVGAGLDYYHTRSIPVFLQVRKAFLDKPQTPFLYINGGYHFPWLNEEDKNQYGWGNVTSKGGLYYDAGIGYQLPVMKSSVLFFTAGFSQKEFSLKQSSEVMITIWPMPRPETKLHEFGLQRLSIQTGLRF
jgi:hypothetical protein